MMRRKLILTQKIIKKEYVFIRFEQNVWEEENSWIRFILRDYGNRMMVRNTLWDTGPAIEIFLELHEHRNVLSTISGLRSRFAEYSAINEFDGFVVRECEKNELRGDFEEI